MSELDPYASPSSVGVKTANNKPLIVILGLVMAFIVIMMLVMIKRSEVNQTEAKQASESVRDSGLDKAKNLSSQYADGVVLPQPPVEEKEEKEDEEDLPVLVQALAQEEPVLPTLDESFDLPPPDPLLLEIKENKQALMVAAISAPSGIPFGQKIEKTARSTQAQAPNDAESLQAIASIDAEIASLGQNDSATLQQQIDSMNAMLDGGSSKSTVYAEKSFSEKLSAPANKDWELGNVKQRPTSKYVIRTGFVIPAILISAINSDLPNQITAQVSQNVYDTATGKHLLIPQGSKLVGSYSSQVQFGQRRVLVAWQRIIYPDGAALDIGSMPSGDAMGRAGMGDQVNNHWWRVFSNALLMSAISAGATLSQDQASGNGINDGRTQRAGDAMSQALGQQLGQTTSQMIQKNLNISPTLEIRSGFRFNIFTTKDITFTKPYKIFDY